ncbi:unnamed protein product [Moneuplotes crassus]|uniref:Uncharacterized protein n=1 Tax=Euplotes crassus TaxID=5936 RepID=A0AAD1Y1Y1_EUPCR|nr:unnamed protein product [Moneuplotes crassus]
MFSINPCDKYFSDEHSNLNFFTEDLGFEYEQNIDLSEHHDLFDHKSPELKGNMQSISGDQAQCDNISIKGVPEEVNEPQGCDLSTSKSIKKSDPVNMSIQEIIDATEMNTPEVDVTHLTSPDCKARRKKRSNLSNTRRRRKDIIFKSILRRCRKYFQSEFNNFCNYSRVKKRRSRTFFFEQITKFYVHMFQEECPDLLIFSAFLNSKDTIKTIDLYTSEESEIESKKQQVRKIHDILYKFTHEKMGVFFEYSLLNFLFKKFVEVEKESLPKGYMQQLETMQTLL